MELFLVAGILIVLVSTTSAYDFYVGGRDGWVQSPSESYNQWASRMRFQVNDSLVFKYKKGEDSVLVVKKEDYDSCNASSPVEKMEDGDSVFRFDRSGPFYFVSGAGRMCAKGQKLVVVVLAERLREIKPPQAPAPWTEPPTSSPYSLSPVYSPTISPSPSLMVPPSYEESPSPAPVPYVKEHSSASVVTLSSLSIRVLVLAFANAVMT